MVSGLEHSLWYSIVTVASAMLLGGGLAVAERLWQQPVRRWFMVLMMIPIFLPPVVVTTSFIATFGTQGIFPLKILYSPVAVVLAYCYYNIPLAYLLLRSAVSRISPATEAAAQLLGANRWQRLTTVLLPQLWIPLLGTAGLIFLYSFTSFILPLQLGSIHGYTLEVWLYQRIYLYHTYGIAMIAALIQLSIIGSVLFIIGRFLRAIMISTVTPEQFGRTQFSFKLISVVYASLIMLPLIGFVVKILSHSTSDDVMTLLNSHFISSLLRTVLVTMLVIFLTTSLVFIGRFGTKGALLLLALSPVTVSFVWYQWFGQGYVSLIGALLMTTLPISMILIQHARQQYAKFFLDTARLLGASWWQRILLEVQLLQPTMRQIVVFGGILVIGDATISSALTPTAQPLAMPYAMQLIGSYRFGVGSLALLAILLLIILLSTFSYARRP